MIKLFTILRKVLFIISVALIPIAFIFTESEAFVVTYPQLLFVLLFVGALLDGSKNETSRKIGIGLVAGVMVTLVVPTIYIFINQTYFPASVVILLIAGIVYLLSLICLFVLYVINYNNPNLSECLSDKKINSIYNWKKLWDDGIITEEQFNEKRNEILASKKVEKVEKLKKPIE